MKIGANILRSLSW